MIVSVHISWVKESFAMPAQAGIQLIREPLRDALDASLRWHDSYPILVRRYQ